ncbi:MAG: insulinase family protein [Eubacterium sp.]|nr:insulinase family protein [Eubacterium sp.]
MNINNIKAYELIEKRRLDDISSDGYLLKHKKSGARVFCVSNDDENKVFSIGFRTPPINSCGLTHILEHSVLCGSKDFPVKDPFVELAKGSLNTFLNAMTYPDKTMYPVASVNEKDFQNLMHVYLDAVFYPNIYKREEIFRQEGWHYELENADDELKINGVVYNEMKGAFSSPEGVLEREILNSLYPDNAYRFESGGDPEVIPELSYETFLEFHSTYYHPSNSYIYLYGDMDMEEKLNWIDEKYLNNFEYKEVDTVIVPQKPFDKMHEVYKTYSVTEDDSIKDNTYLSYNFAVSTSLDRKTYLAFEILDYCLLSAPGAPLKQALLDAGIGKDIMSSFDNGIYQPMFSIVAKSANKEDKDKFLKVIRDTLSDIVKNGVDEKSLLAGINANEFRYREGDAGRFPIGLFYGLSAMDSWLYDENDPFMHLQENEIYAFLKEQVNTGYYEELIKEYLLENNHSTVVIIEPKRGLTAENDAKLKEKLAAYKASLSDEEIKNIVEQTAHLKEYQSIPSTDEELKSIPLLELSDIEKKCQPYYNRIVDENVPVIYHDIESKGIAYFNLLFDTDNVPAEDMPYLSILTSCLGYVDTKNYTFRELANEINIHTGGIGTSVMVYTDADDATHSKLNMRVKSLFEELPKTFDILKEILTSSDLTNDKRLKEILFQIKSRMQMQISSAGNSLAYTRAMSYFSESSKVIDLTGGIDFYEVIKKLTDDFDGEKEDFKKKLSSLLSDVIRPENLIVSFTGKGYDEGRVKELINDIASSVKKDASPLRNVPAKFVTERKNEGFKTASKVNYVARCGNYKNAGFEHKGSLFVLKVIMGYEYMWLNVRVKGGAYGCSSAFDRNGDSFFVSYRDPNLKETEKIYENIPDYLENFDTSDRDMLKYIIGTISMIDTPLKAAGKGVRSLMGYLMGIPVENIQKERNEILSCTKEEIRNLAPYVKAILDFDCRCTVGDENRIEEDKDLFDNIEVLQ